MGEITEALKRANRERQRQNDEDARPRDERSRPPERNPLLGRSPRRGEPEPLPPTRPEEDLPPARRQPDPFTPAAGDASYEPAPAQHISRAKRGNWFPRAVLTDQHSPVAERYRHLAIQVRRGLQAIGSRSVVVTSAVRAEGKTVTACNLALALASVAAGRRVALIDLDLRRHSVAAGLGIQPAVGIESVLRGEASLAEACVATDVGDLDVYPARRSLPAAHELLAGSRLAEVAAELESRYSLVVCDSPPILPVPDVSLVAAHFGACLVVTRAGRTRRAALQELMHLLPEDHLLGTVLNDAPKAANREHYYYHRHGFDEAEELLETDEKEEAPPESTRSGDPS